MTGGGEDCQHEQNNRDVSAIEKNDCVLAANTRSYEFSFLTGHLGGGTRKTFSDRNQDSFDVFSYCVEATLTWVFDFFAIQALFEIQRLLENCVKCEESA